MHNQRSQPVLISTRAQIRMNTAVRPLPYCSWERCESKERCVLPRTGRYLHKVRNFEMANRMCRLNFRFVWRYLCLCFTVVPHTYIHMYEYVYIYVGKYPLSLACHWTFGNIENNLVSNSERNHWRGF